MDGVTRISRTVYFVLINNLVYISNGLLHQSDHRRDFEIYVRDADMSMFIRDLLQHKFKE